MVKIQSVGLVTPEDRRSRWGLGKYRIARGQAGVHLQGFTTDELLREIEDRAIEGGIDADKLRKTAEKFALIKAGWPKWDQWRLLHLYAECIKYWREFSTGHPMTEKDLREAVVSEVTIHVTEGSIKVTGKPISTRAVDNLISKAARAALNDPSFPELAPDVHALVLERTAKNRGPRKRVPTVPGGKVVKGRDTR